MAINKKDLVPMSFPKIPPEQAAGDYLASKLEDKLIKKFPEWDLPRDSPTMELALAKRQLYKTEIDLKNKRAEAILKRKEMDDQWKTLAEREEALKQSFIKFNKFVRENHEKRERAEKRMEEEVNLQERRTKEIAQLQKNMNYMLEVKAEMEQKIREYKMYENYLTSVVKACSDFKTINSLITRYEALMEAKKDLGAKQEKNLSALENAQSNMMKLTEEKRLVIMGLNNEVADLQGRYDEAMNKAFKWESTVVEIKNVAVKKIGEISQVRRACWMIYLQMCKRKEIEPEIPENDIEKQLLFIKKTLSELKGITAMSKKWHRKYLSSSSRLKQTK